MLDLSCTIFQEILVEYIAGRMWLPWSWTPLESLHLE